MGDHDMQNDTNRAKPPTESRFRNRQPQGSPTRSDPRQAVRQGRTDVAIPLPSAENRNSVPRERKMAPDQNLNPVRPSEQRQNQRQPDNTARQGRQPSDQNAIPLRNPASSPRQNERPRPVVVGKPRSEKNAERKPQPVIIDSPNIDSPKNTSDKTEKGMEPKEKPEKDERKFYFQHPRELSTLRKMLILLFGLLFVWCMAPAFFHIIGIGVISSSAVMLGICLTAMFWHLIDRNWTFKKAAVVSLAAIVFAACVTAFSVVSGIMLKASLTAVPNDCPDYTVVVLGCKAHGDQPSWMLSDRLKKAYSVLSKNPNLKCVVTGGQGDDEQFTEAYVMKKYLVEKGISPDRIYVEELAGSTEENLLYTKSLIKLNGLSDNIMIVTDRFRELRARIWAEKSGFKNIYSGCCETRIYLVTGYWFREMFGLARLYVFGV